MTAPSPTLSILLPGLEQRPWQRMVAALYEQADLAGLARVEILTDIDNGQVPSGVKRQRLMQRAKGQYLVFVDDDDRVATEYLPLLLQACETRADVLSFNLEFMSKGRRREVWRFGLYPDRRSRGQMCVNHLCAWKASLARQVSWCPLLGYGDDQVWLQPLFASGRVQTHHHIEKILYTYQYDPNVTANQRKDRVQFAWSYVGRGLRCFFGPQDQILIETGSHQDLTDSQVTVRDAENKTAVWPVDQLQLFHTIRIL